MREILDGDPFGIGLTGYTREEGEAILRGDAIPQPSIAEWPCIHRGEVVELGACNVCGLRGQPFEIFACSVHGRCSIGYRHTAVKSCFRCDDQISIALA